jgi:hypothetical protein
VTRRALRPALLALTGLAAAAPGSAHAAYLSFDDVRLDAARGTVTATLSGEAGCPPEACAWAMRVTQVPRAERCDAELGAAADTPAITTPSATRTVTFAQHGRGRIPRSTAVRLCAFLVGPAGSGLGDVHLYATTYTSASRDPFAGLARAPIPRALGRRRPGLRYVVSLAGRPSGVSRGRWQALTRVAGRRWGMRHRYDTNARVRRGDGVVSVGFGRVPAGALGVQDDRFVERWRAAFTRCDARRCVRYPRRFLGRRLVDQDVTIRDRGVRWQAGPTLPGPQEYDLESVLVHEMGHLAGNKGHAPACAATPMTEGLANGDWWRSPTDFSFRACSAGHASAALVHRASTERVVVPAPR